MTYLGLFLNWLATHLVSLALLVFLLTGFYFREPLFSSSVEPTDHPASPIPTALASLAAPESAGDAAAPGRQISSTVDVPARSEGADAKSSSALQPDGPGQAASVFRPTPSASVPTASVPIAPGEENSGLLFRDPAQDSSANRREAEKSTRKRLAAGRNAFAREDFDSAEMHYLRYLSERPEDPAAFAELGNLYRVMGRTEDALDAYFEAAVRFRDLNEWAEVRQLGGILDRAGDARGTNILGLAR